MLHALDCAAMRDRGAVDGNSLQGLFDGAGAAEQAGVERTLFLFLELRDKCVANCVALADREHIRESLAHEDRRYHVIMLRHQEVDSLVMN